MNVYITHPRFNSLKESPQFKEIIEKQANANREKTKQHAQSNMERDWGFVLLVGDMICAN